MSGERAARAAQVRLRPAKGTSHDDYVVFGDWSALAPSPWVWTRGLTSPGWRHVMLLRDYQATASILLNPMAHYLQMSPYPAPAIEVALGLLEHGASIVRVFTRPQWAYNPRGLHTCVSVVKHALGVRAPWVWTPKQLHQYLIRQGAEPLRRGD